MEQIREIAVQCIGRAVMFGSLAIFCVMVGMSGDIVAAFRAGAFLALIMVALLTWKALAVTTQNPRHTEVWLYLDEQSRPAQSSHKAFALVLQEVYQHYARVTLCFAAGFFILSLLIQLFRAQF